LKYCGPLFTYSGATVDEMFGNQTGFGNVKVGGDRFSIRKKKV
jgi:hypothetical protein